MRIALAIVGFAGAFAAPWLALVAGVALAVRWWAWETILMALICDILWIPQIFAVPIPAVTVGALIVVWALEPLRREFL